MSKKIIFLCQLVTLWWAKAELPTIANEVVNISEQDATPLISETKETTPPVLFTISPLLDRVFTQPTAKHLRQGEVIFNLDNRLFFLPDLVPGGIDNNDTALNYGGGFSWGITDKLELTLQFQHVDSSFPAKQGDFISERTEDNEAAIEIKQQLWQNPDNTKSLSGVVSASWGTRGFMFTRDNEEVEINNRDIFLAFQLPFTATVDRRWQFTISPTLALFNDENAGFYHRLPNDNESSFGTTFGFTGAVSYSLSPRLAIWGDAFIPITGNNSISRESGEPDTAIAYNAGIRYLFNPRLALDLYASNTQGSIGPLALTGDRDFVAFGTNLIFMPDLFAANRRQPDRFSSARQNDDTPTPVVNSGIAFFDGGTLDSGQFLVNVQGGSQGVLTSLRYGFLKDFEAGIYLDYVSGEVDESEQGFSAKIRFLNQAEDDPLTASLAVTIGLTNQPFVNFFNNDRDEFDRRGLEKEVPIAIPGADSAEERKEFIFTASVPLNYQFDNNAAIWFTPTIGYVQRLSTEIAGFNVGGSIPITQEFSILGEVGANFAGEGNGFIGDELADLIPWTVGIRWQPLSLFGLEPSASNTNPQLELYLTNRVGSSTWHQLRVRDQNKTAVGVGLILPF
ncbi:MAG: hypothetical protein QNJ41_06535 [Xenococcaceae cyanobacterium MO_188.B32]|nr:hypothetical protein [Xenococcaceae cyanobacterium MO_188.B32]